VGFNHGVSSYNLSSNDLGNVSKSYEDILLLFDVFNRLVTRLLCQDQGIRHYESGIWKKVCLPKYSLAILQACVVLLSMAISLSAEVMIILLWFITLSTFWLISDLEYFKRRQIENVDGSSKSNLCYCF
jgi:hypothetical protein